MLCSVFRPHTRRRVSLGVPASHLCRRSDGFSPLESHQNTSLFIIKNPALFELNINNCISVIYIGSKQFLPYLCNVVPRGTYFIVN